MDPQIATVKSFLEGYMVSCLVLNDYPCALFGVTTGAIIWMVSTDCIKEIPVRDVIRTAKFHRDFYWRQLQYRTMSNWIHEDNHAHIRFVEFLGGTVYAARNGLRYFELKGEYV